MNSASADAAITRWTGDAMQSRLRRRYRSERNFKLLGFAAVGVSLAFLAFLLGTMLWKGMGGLTLDFLQASDSTDPAMAGVWGALKGSFLTIIVTMALAFPIGVLSAIYLEEFAARNRWTDIIEVSINNLAAVPSIIFGLLGLAVFLNFMHLPRSAPLVGGLTLALMTMPVIVIAGRNAITSVPPSIREAALGVGASKMQVVFHHVLPLALPGILTGTIIGMARALGETAPLLMIGMRAFIAVPPSGITEPATVLPVQIFLWSDEVDRAFVEKTSAAIIVLLVFMLLMNGLAIYLRNRFEQRW
jgi:phosphate transport system permease protein